MSAIVVLVYIFFKNHFIVDITLLHGLPVEKGDGRYDDIFAFCMENIQFIISNFYLINQDAQAFLKIHLRPF